MAPKTKKESTPAPSGAPSSSTSNDSWIATTVVSHYIKNTSQQTKLIDAFMAYLVVVGGIQFLYCVLAGNYPFNSFLSGFSATVGQFVLTASLRSQTNASNGKKSTTVSPERAFADYIFCSLILHFFAVNYMN
ncbi:Dolichyl-diphosphooligosaccharide--protein glycotransferase [Scedosporium apiospermum]|uniref:Dolichyl-diphosphooligosaccharide--protein glycosyltransferase subunit OST2 n=1 Tax=Pseudallescheria apiosperma TaxID=563466 RepID=A0A084GAT5_PSEDA|nr:Dolichyl-diphosphooligosaccharide--protein glycotransferase [Scedosporium apiospermum]KEZ44447.1 Dolichyl-diphosphooligosaccharide--protein glycotransferase [Scedosporium apiospermum]